jgi:uncharacterized protein YqhQ
MLGAQGLAKTLGFPGLLIETLTGKHPADWPEAEV